MNCGLLSFNKKVYAFNKPSQPLEGEGKKKGNSETINYLILLYLQKINSRHTFWNVFFFIISVLDITCLKNVLSIYHTIHPFNVHNSVVLNMLRVVQPQPQFFKFHHPQRNPESISGHSPFPSNTSPLSCLLDKATFCVHRFAYSRHRV